MKQVKGNEVLEYLMAGCKAKTRFGDLDLQDLRGCLSCYCGDKFTENTTWNIDESTRKKENLNFEEALRAMRHGHCVKSKRGLYKLEQKQFMTWDTVQEEWICSHSIVNAHLIEAPVFSIVPDPSVKIEEEPVYVKAVSQEEAMRAESEWRLKKHAFFESMHQATKESKIMTIDGKVYRLTEVE